MKTAIVTDSTCDWALDEYKAAQVHMVPLHVNIGGVDYLDQVDISTDRFYDVMATEKTLPQTSQPSPAEFAQVYDDLADRGYDEIVSIHISSKLSGTVQSAEIAARQCSVPVYVVDTMSVTCALGLIVEAAVEARNAGAQGGDLASFVEQASGSSTLMGVPDSLDNLVRGGRASAAAGWATGVLNIKVVLELCEGKVAPMSKQRGTKGAISKMVKEVAAQVEEFGPLRARILHSRSPQLIAELKQALDKTGLPVQLTEQEPCGAVIGTHLGEGAIGICTMPESVYLVARTWDSREALQSSKQKEACLV